MTARVGLQLPGGASDGGAQVFSGVKQRGWLAAMGKRAIGAVLLAVALACPLAGHAGPPLTLPEWEKRMVQGGYVDTLYAAYWAAAQGEAAVPILAQLLQNRQQYGEERHGAVGAFPFNVLWALGHIPSSKSLKALETYQAATQDATAALAIKGWWLRRFQESSRYGVLVNDGSLLESAGEKSREVKKLKSGQKVKILQEKIANYREVGPRGGPAYYDRVELLPSGEQGYIPRAGDDFTPFI